MYFEGDWRRAHLAHVISGIDAGAARSPRLADFAVSTAHPYKKQTPVHGPPSFGPRASPASIAGPDPVRPPTPGNKGGRIAAKDEA